MTKEAKILLCKTRINKIKAKETYIKFPGVLRKLNRQLRNLEN